MRNSTLARRITRHVSAIGAGLGIVMAGTLAVSGPASAAASVCGSQKTARVSILYKACVAKVGSQDYTSQYLFGNNHGSAISVSYRYGWSVGGHKIWSTTTATLRAAPGFVQIKADEEFCDKGVSVSAIVQVKENNGDWGAIAYSNPYTCS